VARVGLNKKTTSQAQAKTNGQCVVRLTENKGVIIVCDDVISERSSNEQKSSTWHPSKIDWDSD
jgi:hypothetical protein